MVDLKSYLEKALINENDSIRLVIDLVRQTVAGTAAEVGHAGTTAESVAADMSYYTAVRNMRHIHRYADSKSPIEMRFLGSLVIMFAMKMPFSLYMTASPASDVDEIINTYKTGASPYDLKRAALLKDSDDKSDVTFIQKCKVEFLAGRLTRFDLESFVTSTWIRAHYDFGNLIHATPQAAMPNVKVLASGIRPDLLLWIPKRDDFRIIAECDGYETHSGKDPFSRDRKRDRKLKGIDIDVYRFTGDELFHDPVAAADEFFNELMRRVGKLNPPLSDCERTVAPAQERMLVDAYMDAMDYRRFFTAADFGFPGAENQDGLSPEL